MAVKRKLIEVSIPLDEINKQSAREKSIRHGHPSTLHLWWARRPLATARAVLFAQLVDDPSAREDEFLAEARELGYEDPEGWAGHRIKQERERLFDLMTRMSNWDNLGDEALFNVVRAEIMKSTGGNPPAILDPFAGGGTIPLEAQRLGLQAHASDLNPVAVLINKALVEIPPKYVGREPVFPGAAGTRLDWPKASGLAEDVRRYGEWMRVEAEKRIGHLYPKAKLPGDRNADVIAWIWARSAMCVNPACRANVPLVSTLQLGRKSGKEYYLSPKINDGEVSFEVRPGVAKVGANKAPGRGTGFRCWVCEATISASVLHDQLDVASPPSPRLLAVVAAGNRERLYLNPSNSDLAAADIAAPPPELLEAVAVEGRGTFGGNAQGRRWGFFTFADYFSNRQLVALTTLSQLVRESRARILADAADAEASNAYVERSRMDTEAYADAVVTYLGLAVSRVTAYSSTLATWSNHPKNELVVGAFGRQAIPMTWDYAESNPLNVGTSGSLDVMVSAIRRTIEGLGFGVPAQVSQADAATVDLSNAIISTDPPYYDNIVYSDLSDYFYVWLRSSLRALYPEILSTVMVPKAEELVANSYRLGGAQPAKVFFEKGFERVFAHARRGASDSFPITVYYAFKQVENEDSVIASTGWETILSSIVRAGWRVTATWPVRSEFSGRMVASGTNALASSVVLALRPRPVDAPVTDRRGFIGAMRRELGPALRELQQGGIAPVDLPQSAIGPGMAVFSRYAKVIESDGSEMSVRSALARINEVLDELLTEQEGDFDATTRFALAWYRGNGYESGAFGDAENLARARATAVAAMERGGILSARAGRVQLYRPVDLPDEYDVSSDQYTSAWEALQHTIRVQETKGIPAAGAFLRDASRRADGAVDLDLVKELAYLLFQIAEKNGWTKDAISFNGVATSWSELLEAGRTPASADTAVALDFTESG